MGFFNKMFGSRDTEDKVAGDDFITALSMHLRGEKEAALAAYGKIAAQAANDNLAAFFASAITAGKGGLGDAVESLRFLSQQISSGGKTISRVIAEELFALMNEELHISAPAVAEIIVTFGDQLKKEGFVQESAVCFEIAAGVVPDDADLLHKFGDTLHDLRLYDYAESVLKEALKCEPRHWGALYTYAVLLQDLGRIAEAITCYEKAVELNPDHVKCRNNFGAALMMAGRLEEALTHCTLAAELDPGFPMAKINLGNIYLLKNSYEAARTCFTEAISLDGNLATGYFGLGSAEAFLGSDSGQVRELYLKAIGLDPSFALAHYALANLLAKEGNPDALTHFSAAAQLNNNLTNLHRDFGAACLQQGRREEALEQLRIALQQNPDDAMARDMLSKAEEENRV